MQIGVVFPQTEIGTDLGGLRAYATAAGELGFEHLLAYDHVLGADPSVHADLPGPYTMADQFHEPMVLFGWLAAFTQLELVTGILIAPQRQTALIAKQAAEVDLLSGGRLRLGLAIGWNRVEYDALGQDFSTRGQRLEEQIGLLRRLWADPSVTVEGTFDRIVGAGIAPRPLAGTIPLWLGGVAPAALQRVGRLADGWFPMVRPGGGLEPALEIIAAAAEQAGRDPAAIGFEGRVEASATDPGVVARHARRWREAGATHLSVNTMGAGLATVDQHIAALGWLAEAMAGD